jgi:hypothetical protein
MDKRSPCAAKEYLVDSGRNRPFVRQQSLVSGKSCRAPYLLQQWYSGSKHLSLHLLGNSTGARPVRLKCLFHCSSSSSTGMPPLSCSDGLHVCHVTLTTAILYIHGISIVYKATAEGNPRKILWYKDAAPHGALYSTRSHFWPYAEMQLLMKITQSSLDAEGCIASSGM